jgi:hypothetical protein
VVVILPRPKSSNKGDPKEILNFLKAHEPLSEEDAEKMIAEVEKGRKRIVAQKIDFE